MKYSVKTKSSALMSFPIMAMVIANLAPLEGWAQFALLGIACGAIGGFVGKPYVERSFDPADAPLAEKRRVVAIFGLARLGLGFLIIFLGALAHPALLSPTMIALGGYLAGSTLATPLSAAELGPGA